MSSLSYRLPRGFIPIPLNDDVLAGTGVYLDALVQVGGASPEVMREQATYAAQFGAELVKSGIQLAGYLTLQDSPPSVNAVLTVGLTQLSGAISDWDTDLARPLAVKEIAKMMRVHEPESKVVESRLPLGEVVIALSQMPTLSSASESGVVTFAEMKVLIPDSSLRNLYAVGITTSSEEHADELVQKGMEFLNSLSFGQ